MIVSISGVSCTGKTTTIQMLQKQGFPVITPSASRLASGYKFPTPEAKDRFIFETGHNQYLQAEQIASSTGKVVFLDRSQFDNWSFRLVYGGDLSYEPAFLADIKALDFVWILDPADVPFVHDGVRPDDVAKRSEWHKLMLEKAKAMHLRYEVLSGTPQQRLEHILDAMRRQYL